MKSKELTGLLKNLKLFQGLDQCVIEKAAAKASVIYAEKQQTLIHKGEICRGFFVVMYGGVRLSLFSSRGVERPIQVAGPGASFGEATMFQEVARYATSAIALQDSALLFVPKEVISSLLQADWRLGERMLTNLSQHVRLLVDDIDDSLLQPPARRLSNYLIRMVPAGEMAPCVVVLTLKKNLIAAQLNLTPETLSRYFREFCMMGQIAVEGSRVTILDVKALGRYVAQVC